MSVWARMLLLAGVVVAASACRNDRYGKSIGRPSHDPVDYDSGSATSSIGVEIVEVYPAMTGAYVELLASADVTLSDYQLETQNGVLALSGSIASGERLLVAIDATTLFAIPSGVLNPAQSGEIALVEIASSEIVSYFAWGALPSTLGSTLAQRAGALATRTIDVPYPRDATTSIIRENDYEGCALPTEALEPDGAACPEPARALLIDEVFGQRVTGDVSWVVIENISGTALDITGLRICHEMECGELLSAVAPLADASTLTICVGAIADATICPETGAQLAAADPVQAIHEVYLLAPGVEAPDTSSNLLDYMRTTLASTTFEEQAITQGLWADDVAPTPTFVSGESESRNPGTTAPPAWFPATATPAAVNPVIDRTSNWQSCAEPADLSAATARLMVTSVSRASGTLRLANVSSGVVDLSTFLVRFGGSELTQDGAALSGSLAVNAALLLTASVGESGTASITQRASGTQVQFVQWGNRGTGVTAAVTGNVWPAESCVAPRIGAGGALVLRDVTLARGSGGYSN